MYKQISKKLIIVFLVIAAFGILILQPSLFIKARSYLVMSAYSNLVKINSLLNELNVRIDIPGGTSTKEKDWYPFVLVYNADAGFSKHIGRDLSLTILYNFGAFDWKNSTSTFYDAKSPYYNSFYGAYIVKEHQPGRKFAFDPEGQPIIDEVVSVPEYDFKYLVMESLGCPPEKLTMEALSYEITEGVSYAGYDGWHRMDGLLLVNNPNHRFRSNRKAYLQFGNPIYYEDREEFGLITMQGRIYARYFEEIESTVFLYIMTPGSTALEECDQKILSKTVISFN